MRESPYHAVVSLGRALCQVPQRFLLRHQELPDDTEIPVLGTCTGVSPEDRTFLHRKCVLNAQGRDQVPIGFYSATLSPTKRSDGAWESSVVERVLSVHKVLG